MKKKIVFFIVLIILAVQSFAENKSAETNRLAWFDDAKLGVFIHWGIYSVNGISASWSMKNKEISWQDYMAQSEGFTAQNYNPEEWARLFKQAGAKYVVLTSKHHDGFALWDTKFSLLDAVNHSAAQRDLLAPYARALRKQGLKVGFYFSLLDWSHKDYDVVFERPRQELEKLYPQPAWQKNLSAHERFVKFVFGQLSELSHQYHPDLLWFDGGWEHSSQWWRAEEIRDSLLTWNPQIIINDRLPEYGDYETAEQGIPVLRPKKVWEFCMTINDHWGYFPKDNNYKPQAQIIRTFVEVIANGGNLLLDIGPKPDGTIDERQIKALKELGAWIRRNEEAVYSTRAGLPYGHFYGPTLLSADKKIIYLALFDIPKDYILLKGLHTKIKKIRIVGSERELQWKRSGGAKWANIPGIVRIDVPERENLDKYVTVLAVELADTVQLFRGGGKAIESN